MVTELEVSGFKIELEETALTDAQAHLGGTIKHGGDAAESLHWLCYQLGGRNHRSLLWLFSGEMNGGAVGGFQWSAIASDANSNPGCVTLTGGSVRLPHNLRPGMSISLVHQVLGAPTRVRGDITEYVHEEPQQIRDQPYIETNVVEVLIRSGRVRKIEVWKSTSS